MVTLELMMRSFFAAVLFFVSALAFGQAPEKRLVPVENVFIPAGFDSNDPVEVVITGFLPNLCHKSPKAEVEVSSALVKINVESFYYPDSKDECAEMAVPFVEVVSLGILRPGGYQVKVKGAGIGFQNGELDIEAATSATIDDFNYAYVDYIEKEPGENTVLLKGYNPSNCFILDEIEYFSNSTNTYSILPKMKRISQFCPKKMTPFSYEFTVPNELEASQILLHVRTLNGKSVNTIFSRM